MRRLALIATTALWPVFGSAQSDLSAEEQEDKSFFTKILENALSGSGQTVEITRFEGVFSSEVKIETLMISDAEGLWLSASDLVLQWDRGKVLDGSFDIGNLQAQSVDVFRKPNIVQDAPVEEDNKPLRYSDIKPETEPFTLPDLAFAINIENVEITELHLEPEVIGQSLDATLKGSAILEKGEGSTSFDAHRTDERLGQFTIEGAFSNKTRILALDIDAEEGPDGIAANLLNIPDRPALALQVKGEGLLEDYTADIALASDGIDRVTGTFTTRDVAPTEQEAAEGRAISLDLAGDLTPFFQPAYQPFFGEDSQLTGDVMLHDDGRKDITDVAITTATLDVQGDVSLDPQGWPNFIDVTGNFGNAERSPVLLPVGNAETTLEAAFFTVQYDDTLRDNLAVFAIAEGYQQPGIAFESTEITGTGRLASGFGDATGNFDLGLDFLLGGLETANPEITQALGRELSGSAQIDRTEDGPLFLRDLRFTSEGLTGAGQAQFQGIGNDLKITGGAKLETPNLARFSGLTGQRLSGSGTVSVSGEFLPLTNGFDIVATAQTKDLGIGNPAVDRALSGLGNLILIARRNERGIEVEELTYRTPTAFADATAMISSQATRAEGRLSVSDLGVLQPGLNGFGEITANVNLPQTGAQLIDLKLEAPGANGTLSARAPALNAEAQANIDGTFDIRNLGLFNALLSTNLSGGATGVITGTAQVNGSRVDVEASGATQNLGIGTPSVDTLLRGTGDYAVNITRAPSGVLGLSRLRYTTPELTLTGDVQAAPGGRSAEFDARIRDISVLAPAYSGPASVVGTASQQGNGPWNVDATGTAPGNANAAIRGQVQPGQLNLSATGYAPLGYLNVPLGNQRVSGDLNFDLALNGPAALSSVSGTATIANGEFSAPVFDQTLTNVNGTVQIANAQARVAVEATNPKGGAARAAGTVGLVAPYPINVIARLDGYIVRDPALYVSSITGEVAITGPAAGGGLIAGDLALSDTEIRVPSSGLSSLGDLPEVRHINPSREVQATINRAAENERNEDRAQQSRSESPVYDLRINVASPDKVFVRGRGLEAELGGAIVIGGTTRNVVPIGSFDLLRGRLNILRRNFALSNGSIVLQGSFIPYITLTATTQTRDGIEVDLTIEGDANTPEVIITSSPSLPQDEILARLIFGRDITEITPIQAVQLASAVAQLAGRGGSAVVDDFRQDFGLDALDVTTDGQGGAGVQAGKYIADNVYTNLSVDTEGETEVSINIDLTPDITMKGQTSTNGETSLGIFFERDY